MSMSEYTFSFDTCEKSNKTGVAQPYSALFNLISCLIILFFLLKTKKLYTFLLLFSFFCFEVFHVFSHIIHINGPIQINITHSLAYLINIAYFYAFYSYTKKLPSFWVMLCLLILVCLDTYSFLYLSIVYYLITQFSIFILLFVYYLPLLPKFIKNGVYQIVFLLILIILLFLNETYNCEKMLQIYPAFPYHIFIEIAGVILFYIICSIFYKL